MEFDHHGAVHFCSVHIVDALHVDEVLILACDAQHLLVAVLVGDLVVQVLVDRNVLEMVLVLFLAAQRQFRALVQLVRVALPRDIHHDEVLSELILVSIVHSDRVMVHLAVVLHGSEHGRIVRMDA